MKIGDRRGIRELTKSLRWRVIQAVLRCNSLKAEIFRKELDSRQGHVESCGVFVTVQDLIHRVGHLGTTF